MADSLPFFQRLILAFACFFRVLFDGTLAARVERALEGAAELPPLTEAEKEKKSVSEAHAKSEAMKRESLGEPQAKSEAMKRGGGTEPRSGRGTEPRSREAEPVRADTGSALQLLGLFQREGRLVDFLQQDVAAFPDAEIGAAARVVHEGCRKALRSHATVESIRDEEEGARVTLESDFDKAAVKLTGNVSGSGPYTGVLRHRGWRVAKLELPKVLAGHDATIVAPAEVEL